MINIVVIDVLVVIVGVVVGVLVWVCVIILFMCSGVGILIMN